MNERMDRYYLYLKSVHNTLLDLGCFFMSSSHKEASETAKELSSEMIAISEKGVDGTGTERMLALYPEKIKAMMALGKGIISNQEGAEKWAAILSISEQM